MPPRWPWYELVNSLTDLQQGDILEGMIVPVARQGTGEVVEEEYTLIVMTQSCDIEDDIPHLVFCPVWTPDELAASGPNFRNRSTMGSLLSGRVIGFYPINKCALQGMKRPWRIIQFQRILELERTTVLGQIDAMGNRLRLLPPYRESLAQQFARFFMRVGLPVPVDTS